MITSYDGKESYFFGTFLLDVAAGVVAVIAIIPTAVFLGGFSFSTPWLIVTPVLLFTVGVLRGGSTGNVWLKAISISTGCLLLLISRHNTTARPLVLAALTTVLPTVGGISFRRYRLLRSSSSGLGSF